MIISKKRFEEELAKRRQKEEFERGITEDIYKLQDEVRQLRWKVDMLENQNNPQTPTNVRAEP